MDNYISGSIGRIHYSGVHDLNLDFNPMANTDKNNKALLIVPMDMNSEYFAAHG